MKLKQELLTEAIRNVTSPANPNYDEILKEDLEANPLFNQGLKYFTQKATSKPYSAVGAGMECAFQYGREYGKLELLNKDENTH